MATKNSSPFDGLSNDFFLCWVNLPVYFSTQKFLLETALEALATAKEE